jgi:transposase
MVKNMVQGKEKTMNEKREIILLLRKSISIRKISRDLHIHRSIVRALRDSVETLGWLDPNTPMPSDFEIAQHFLDQSQSVKHPLDTYFDDIKQWKEEGINAVVIQRLLRQKHQYACSTGSLQRYIKKQFPPLPDPVMIRFTKAGEIMDVDFGFLGKLWDDSIHKFRKIWVFSARLRHSRKAYRELVWKQDTTTFLLCHIHAFEHFNGVPEKVVLDNLKAGVIKNCIDNDLLNRSYLELAEYYSFIISPCLPCKPEHKGGVENDIKYIKRNFWPQLKEKIKVYPQLGLMDGNEELKKWDDEVANIRRISGISRTPQEIFNTEEVLALRSLPAVRWEPIEWFSCVVGKDWLIRHNGSMYSVPYMLIGQTVFIRITSQFLTVYFEHQPITQHQKATIKGSYQRNPLHAPPFKDVVLFSNRHGLLVQAEELGPNIAEFCKKMLTDNTVDKLRPVRSLLQLVLRYDKNRLDKACERAVKYNTIRYASVKHILERGLDLEPVQEFATTAPQVQYKFARHPSEYRF